jgi:TIR domain
MADRNVAETMRYKTHDAPLPSGNIRYRRSGEGRRSRGGGGTSVASADNTVLADPGYEWDVFVSYRRNGNVGSWVQNHLAPVLVRCLEDELPESPRIFIDTQQDVGTKWPDNIVRALVRSRLLLAVWSPSYFTSQWCLAEWQTMLLREQLLGIGSPANPIGLVYPIVFSDGDSFPPETRRVQQVCFKDWRVPYPHFRKSVQYVDFHWAVVRVAEDLAKRLPSCPIWRRDWPIAKIDQVHKPALRYPQL